MAHTHTCGKCGRETTCAQPCLHCGTVTVCRATEPPKHKCAQEWPCEPGNLDVRCLSMATNPRLPMGMETRRAEGRETKERRA